MIMRDRSSAFFPGLQALTAIACLFVLTAAFPAPMPLNAAASALGGPGREAASGRTSLRAGTDFVYVYRDGGAGGYEAFPDVCRLNDGRLMCVFYAGYDHVALPNARWPKGGRIDVCFSSDEGRTWTKPGTLYDGPDDDRDASVVQLADGRLLCSFFTTRRNDNSPKKREAIGTWIIESNDLGRTWSAPRPIAMGYFCSSPVRVLHNGGLLLGLYSGANGRSWGAVVRSEDGGRTWTKPIDIPNGGWKLDAETDIIELKDGSILAAEREPATTMCYSMSRDGGRSWSVSLPLGFPGHCPYFLRTTGGVLLLAHRLPQTSLHYSFDEGRTWSANIMVDDLEGAYPSMVELKDGSVLIVYYEEGDGSNIRARRFRVGPSGVEWLSLARGKAAADASAVTLGPVQDPGAPAVKLDREGDMWRITGRRNIVSVDTDSLRISVRTPSAEWTTLPSFDGDLTLGNAAGRSMTMTRLASAAHKTAGPGRIGSLSGLRISLKGFAGPTGQELDASLDLFIGLEGDDEELVCRIAALDGEVRVREVLWPASFEPNSFDAAVVPFMQGMLLPKNWARQVRIFEPMSYGRGLYMPWWGYEHGASSVMVLLETPDDAGFRFKHPAGGPTRMDVRWVHSLGRWSYPRQVRFAFLANGDYVALAKRYRHYVMEKGTFVSLKEKIARNPLVGKLIGAPVIHTGILQHIQPGSSYYKKDDPAWNHRFTTFDERASELKAIAALGIHRAYVYLDGWGFRGYDNLHPDVLPPCPEAGGWDGMKRLADACDALGFVFAVHDQYRDYYLDGPAYDPGNGRIDEDGGRPFESTWFGGGQTILCPALAPGFVSRNHSALLAHGIKLRGAYLDVFSIVPPEECYSPEHPVTRTECLKFRSECFNFVRSYGGVVSSEEPCDWAVPFLDLVHHGPFALDPDPGKGPAMGIPIPLFDLVYHDAILLPWSLDKGAWASLRTTSFPACLGHAGLPYLSIEPKEEELTRVRTMCALNARVGLLEMTGHEFLDASFRQQRFTYSDGTTVTIDLDSGTCKISPELEVPATIDQAAQPGPRPGP